MAMVQVPEEEEELVYAKLQTMPVLPEDYPLFDWADWPRSYEALVPGTATKQFERACWNAIVNTLGDAMEAAGLDFYRSDEGFTAADICMATDRLDVLTAVKMNDLIAAIDDVVTFHWPWRYDLNHPGKQDLYYWEYVEHGFQGKYTNHVERANIVYAQYFLDIVHRLNLILQLMRGNYPLHTDLALTHSSASTVAPNLRRGYAGRIYSRQACRISLPDTPLWAPIGLPMEITQDSRIQNDTAITQLPAGTLRISRAKLRNTITFLPRRANASPMGVGRVNTGIILRAVLETICPAEIAFSFAMKSQADVIMGQVAHLATAAREDIASVQQAAMTAGERLPAGSILAVSSEQSAAADKAPSAAVSARTTAGSNAWAAGLKTVLPAYITASVHTGQSAAGVSVFSGLLAPMETEPCGARSWGHADLALPSSAPVSASGRSRIGRILEIPTPRTKPLWSLHRSKTAGDITVDNQPVGIVESAVHGKTLAVCSLGTAWDAPVWVDGGLWIRQVRTAKIKNGGLDLSGSGDPLGAVLNSETRIVAALDNAWLAPVWVDGGLYIRQVRQTEVLEDGSLDLTGAGDQLLATLPIRTNTAVTLDTAWDPPAWVDGGLYIRQAQTAVQNDNNELEVH